MQRIPETSLLHLIFCRQVQGSFFRGERKNCVVKKWRDLELNETACFKLVRKKSKAVLQPLDPENVPIPTDARKLVIVMCESLMRPQPEDGAEGTVVEMLLRNNRE
jgi:hypothetical protein